MRIKYLMALLTVSFSATAFALSPRVQADLLMSRITAAVKADNYIGALPDFAELESLAPSLSKPLPEAYYYYYVEALDKAGKSAEALHRSEIYIDRFGEKGRYYYKVIPIMSRAQLTVREEIARVEILKEDRMNKYKKDMFNYLREKKEYDKEYEDLYFSVRGSNQCDLDEAANIWRCTASNKISSQECADKYTNCERRRSSLVKPVKPTPPP